MASWCATISGAAGSGNVASGSNAACGNVTSQEQWFWVQLPNSQGTAWLAGEGATAPPLRIGQQHHNNLAWGGRGPRVNAPAQCAGGLAV